MMLNKYPNIFIQDRGIKIAIEYRVGPEVTCEAVAISSHQDT